MSQFDAKADTPTDTLAVGDKFPFGSIAADGWDTITAAKLLLQLALRTDSLAAVKTALGIGGGGVGGAVDSVNGQTGVVVLNAASVGADATGTAAALLTAHLLAADPHSQYTTAGELSTALASYLTTTAAVAGYQPLAATLNALAALTTTSYGRALLTLADAPAARTALVLGSLATASPTGTPDGTKFLRDDLTWQTVSGGGAGGTLFAQTADVTLGNSNTESSLVGSGVGSASLAAGALVAGKRIRIRASGVHSTLASGAGTLTWRIKFGGSTIVANAPALAASQSNTAWTIDIEVVIRSTGVSGSVLPSGWMLKQGGSTPGAYVSAFSGTSPVTVDTTVTLAVDLTAQWSNANASNTLTCQQLSVEVIP